jgi:hypothetical protein
MWKLLLLKNCRRLWLAFQNLGRLRHSIPTYTPQGPAIYRPPIEPTFRQTSASTDNRWPSRNMLALPPVRAVARRARTAPWPHLLRAASRRRATKRSASWMTTIGSAKDGCGERPKSWPRIRKSESGAVSANPPAKGRFRAGSSAIRTFTLSVPQSRAQATSRNRWEWSGAQVSRCASRPGRRWSGEGSGCSRPLARKITSFASPCPLRVGASGSTRASSFVIFCQPADCSGATSERCRRERSEMLVPVDPYFSALDGHSSTFATRMRRTWKFEFLNTTRYLAQNAVRQPLTIAALVTGAGRRRCFDPLRISDRAPDRALALPQGLHTSNLRVVEQAPWRNL